MFNSKNASTSWQDASFARPVRGRKHYEVPPLMVGFDLETSGLDTTHDQPVSYGIAVYRHGIRQDHESHHFLVAPTVRIGQKATETHGWTNQDLDYSHGNGVKLKDHWGTEYDPALDQATGASKAAQILAHYQKQGAVMLGANHVPGPRNNNTGYDIPMFKSVYKKFNGLPLHTSGFDPDKMKHIDVQEHEDAVDPRSTKNGSGERRSRKMDDLAPHYGVEIGGHRALDDAVAAIEIFKKQVELNRKNAGFPTRTASAVGESGIDYGRASYCTGKDCNFCKHLDTVELSKKPTGEGEKMGDEEKSHVKIIKNIRKVHQNMGK